MFPYTSSEQSENEIERTISLIITSRRIKYLIVNLPKEVKDLYIENYKTFMREVKEDLNKWKDILCSWIERPNIVKM